MEYRGKKDVIVVGSGPAGLAAAIASARNGASTLLVERYGFLGGNLTGALVSPFMTSHYEDTQVNAGLLKELVDRLVSLGGSLGPCKCYYEKGTCGTGGYITQFDPEVLKYVAFEMVQASRVELLLHSFLSDVVIEGKRIRGVEVTNKSGKQVILADVVVDATGDGDVAALAGAGFNFGDEETGITQPGTLFFYMEGVDFKKVKGYMISHPEQFNWMTFPVSPIPIPEGFEDTLVAGSGFIDLISQAKDRGELAFGRQRITFFSGLRRGQFVGNATRIAGMDATKVDDLTFAEVEGRKQLMSLVNFLVKYVPGFDRAYLSKSGVQVGIRESRQIQTEYMITEEDILFGRQFSDVAAKGAYPIDIHKPAAGVEVRGNDDTWTEIQGPYDIPYRALIPRGIDGLLVAGRCIGGTHQAMGAFRVMPIAMSIGEAAGTAAALASRAAMPPRNLDAAELQGALVSQGAYLG
ncbi:MAG: FAD-dependent oxidoreductase [Firmicutes bacterium]|nr:FAD-dependent oxidoreductase [Bacillota bacterium]